MAEIPIGGSDTFGVFKAIKGNTGINHSGGTIVIDPATTYEIKTGGAWRKPISVGETHSATFYGLAKAAGDATQSASSNAVGTYTETAKSAISDMLNGAVQVSGATPTITALSGVRYVCGEVSTLDITPCASGICDIVFTSGSTATVLTLPNTVKFPDGTFTPKANTTYELNIMDGVYGAVMAWT